MKDGVTVNGNNEIGEKVRKALVDSGDLNTARRDLQASWNDWNLALARLDKAELRRTAKELMTVSVRVGALVGSISAGITTAIGTANSILTNPELRAHLRAVPLASPVQEIKLIMPDLLKVQLMPSAGIVLDYDQDGHVVGTRPRETAQ